MSWDDVKPGGEGNDFLKIEAGKKMRLHVLTDEPHSYKQAFYNDLQRGAILDDETKELVSDRKSIRVQHAFWVLTEAGETKIWQVGNRVAEMLKGIYEEYGTFAEIDLVVSRSGTGKETKYTVTPGKVQIDASSVDVSTLTPLEEVLVPAASDVIEKLEAGIDPSTEFDAGKLETEAAPRARKQAPVEEEETPAAPEPEEEEAPPPAKKPVPGAGPDPKMPVIREIMTLLAKHPKYKTLPAKQALFKRCAPGKSTVSAMNLQELIKVRNELKKA